MPTCNFIKKRLWHSSYPMKFAKFWKTLFIYIDHLWETIVNRNLFFINYGETDYFMYKLQSFSL